jgi:hypothetical protein
MLRPVRHRRYSCCGPRLTPLLAQLDFARERVTNRMAGPAVDSGDGVFVEIRP